jgi:hypothetical protein
MFICSALPPQQQLPPQLPAFESLTVQQASEYSTLKNKLSQSVKLGIAGVGRVTHWTPKLTLAALAYEKVRLGWTFQNYLTQGPIFVSQHESNPQTVCFEVNWQFDRELTYQNDIHLPKNWQFELLLDNDEQLAPQEVTLINDDRHTSTSDLSLKQRFILTFKSVSPVKPITGKLYLKHPSIKANVGFVLTPYSI